MKNNYIVHSHAYLEQSERNEAKMEKYIRYLIVFLVFTIFIPVVQAVELDVISENVILYNLDEDKVLYEKDSGEKISIASMTKIMTAIVALEHIHDLEERIVLTSSDFEGLEEANASVAGFSIGQIVTYRDLLYGLLLPSGADAALALTRTVAGGRENFIDLMNQKAEELNLKNTHFMNETGLDEENHYSTVEDVTTIFKYALQNEDFKEMITNPSYTISDKSLIFQSTTSKNLKRYGLDMEYVKGGKTGSTFDAGLCLASVAEYDNVHYMLVTARAPYGKTPYHLLDARTIYGYFIENFSNQFVIEKEDIILEIGTKYAKEKNISIYADENIQKYVPKDFKKKDLEFEYDGIIEVDPFIKKGTKLGMLTIRYDGDVIATKDIILNQKVSLDIKNYVIEHKIEVIILGIIFSFIVMCFIILKKIYRKLKL